MSSESRPPVQEDPSRLLEQKLELLDEIERLESGQERAAAQVGKALLPALLFGGMAPLLWSPPIWVMLCGPLLLGALGLAYLLATGRVRTSRETWRTIQRLKREVAFLESFSGLEDGDFAALEAIHRMVEEDVEE